MHVTSFTQARILAKVLNIDPKNYQICLPPNSYNLNMQQQFEFEKLVTKVENGYPLDYILGKVEFCNNDFLLDTNVLIPRPETEDWVSNFTHTIQKKLSNYNGKLLIDIGCGCGVIGLTLANYFTSTVLLDYYLYPLQNTNKNIKALELENAACVYFSDLFMVFIERLITQNSQAINFANPKFQTKYFLHYSNGSNVETEEIEKYIDYTKFDIKKYINQNQKKLLFSNPSLATKNINHFTGSKNSDIPQVIPKSFIIADSVLDKYLAQMKEQGFVITANLPYVPTTDLQSVSTNRIAYEPQNAIFSGITGMDHTKRLLEQLDFLKQVFGLAPHEIHFELDIRTKKE